MFRNVLLCCRYRLVVKSIRIVFGVTVIIGLASIIFNSFRCDSPILNKKGSTRAQLANNDDVLTIIKDQQTLLPAIMKPRLTAENETKERETKPRYTSSEKMRNSGLKQFLDEEELIGEKNSTIHTDPYGSIREQCDQLHYDLTILPKTSVVVTFHNTESLENLLRTVRSIIKRTPSELLEEVVLIADNVTKYDLTTVLDERLAAINRSDLITLIRSEKQLGLIKARLLGIRVARGPVVMCMDSHMEVQKRWLEPLLIEIYHNPKVLVSPSLDWMSLDEKDGRWTMKTGGNDWKTFFDWSLAFGWQEMSHFDSRRQKQNVTLAYSSPMTIGTFGIAKKWFTTIGEFDEGMQAWGGENIDLPLRVWLFGGRVVNVPCSHVAHFEKPGSRDYRNKWMPLILRNHKRIVEVWWDDYRKYFYYYNPDMALIDAGNLSARFELKKRAKYDFKWILEHVYPELGMYDVNTLGCNGAINLAYPNKCIHGGGQSDYNLYDCLESNKIQQGIYWNMEGDLRYPTYRANSYYRLEKHRYVITGMGVIGTHRASTNSVWFHWRDGPLIDPVKNLCLEALTPDDIVLLRCELNKKSQQWRFKSYTEEYMAIFKGDTSIKYKSAFLYQLSKIIKASQSNRLLDIPSLVQNYTYVLSKWPVTRTISPQEADKL